MSVGQREMSKEPADWSIQNWRGYANLGRALGRLRETAGLTQSELAEQLGVSRPQVSHIEAFRGGRRIPVETFFLWLIACNRHEEVKAFLASLEAP